VRICRGRILLILFYLKESKNKENKKR